MTRMSFLRFLARKVLPYFADIEVYGDTGKLPKGGYMLASNHLGRLDSLVVYYVIENDDLIHPLTDKYKKYFFARIAAWLMRVTWLTRGQADMKAMREFISRLKNGGVMIIAPEGTRSKSGQLLKAEAGAVYIAASAGVGIIPVAITGTDDSYVKECFRKFRKIKITITAGDGLYYPPNIKSTKGADRDALLQTAIDEVMCRIAALLPEERRGYYKEHSLTKELLTRRNA